MKALVELRARAMVRLANRTFKKRPNRLDRLAQRLVATAVSRADQEKSDRR